MPLTKDVHAYPHVLSGTRQRMSCLIQSTKEPYWKVIWAIREMVCGKKRGVGEPKTRDEMVRLPLPACTEVWESMSKGFSKDITYFQSVLSRYR